MKIPLEQIVLETSLPLFLPIIPSHPLKKIHFKKIKTINYNVCFQGYLRLIGNSFE